MTISLQNQLILWPPSFSYYFRTLPCYIPYQSGSFETNNKIQIIKYIFLNYSIVNLLRIENSGFLGYMVAKIPAKYRPAY